MFPILLLASLAADPGPLVVVGGGPTLTVIADRVVTLAGGPKARILIVPQASSKPAESGKSSAEFWRERKPASVQVLDATQPDAAMRLIAECDLLWMPGGDQNRLLDVLGNAGLLDAIRARHAAGAVVGGTSAGAAAMTARCLTGDADAAAVKRGGTRVRAGLGLWSGAVVDQHFLKRDRFARLLAAVLDDPTTVGVGIDESTAVIVSATGWEVIGAGQVVIVDARKATVARGTAGELAAGQGVTLHLFKAGDRFTP